MAGAAQVEAQDTQIPFRVHPIPVETVEERFVDCRRKAKAGEKETKCFGERVDEFEQTPKNVRKKFENLVAQVPSEGLFVVGESRIRNPLR